MVTPVQDPNISFQLVDQSVVVPTTPAIVPSLSFLAGLFSSKGDRQFREYVQVSALRDVLGSDIDNYDTYGQPGMNAVAAINGGASVFACRLLPNDATTAFIVIGISVQQDAAIPQYVRNADGSIQTTAAGVPVPQMNAGVAVTAPGVRVGVSKVLVTGPISNFNWAPVDSTDANGPIVTYPIFALSCYSDGLFGNNYGFSMVIDGNRDSKLTDGRRYIMNLYEQNGDGTVSSVTNSIYFSFSPGAVLPTNTQIQEVITSVFPSLDVSGNVNPIVLEYNLANWNTLMAALAPFAGSATTTEIDPFFVTQLNTFPYDTIIPMTSSINLSQSIVYMSGGTDGSLQLGATVTNPTSGQPQVVDAAWIAATQQQLLQQFYNCDYNADLLDMRLVPAGFSLDANYSLTVKQAMINLTSYRPDIMTFLDLGINVPSAQQALTLYTQVNDMIAGANAWNIVICPHAGVTTDQANARRVTQTYELSYDIPAVYANFGRYSTVGGMDTGAVTHMKLDWTPQMDKSGTLQKMDAASLLYCRMLDRSGTPYIMNISNQYNKQYSKMKFWRNGAIVGDAMRNANKILIKYVFDQRGATKAVIACNKEMAAFFNVNNYPGSIKVVVNVFQSANDVDLNRASAQIFFYFDSEIADFDVTIYSRNIQDYQGAA